MTKPTPDDQLPKDMAEKLVAMIAEVEKEEAKGAPTTEALDETKSASQGS